MQTVMIFYYISFFPLILGSMSIFYRLFFLMVRILMTCCIYPYAHIYAYKLLCVMLCVCPFVTIVDRPVCVSEPFISMFYQ